MTARAMLTHLERMKRRAAVSRMCALGRHNRCGGGLVTGTLRCQCDCHRTTS